MDFILSFCQILVYALCVFSVQCYHQDYVHEVISLSFLESIIAETREMFRPDGMIEFYQSPEFWEMLEKYTKKVKDNKK